MQIYNLNQVESLPNDMDNECIDLCNTLNRLPHIHTYESCMGHGKHPFWVFFKCTDINELSRLGRAVERNYSDGNWEIVVDSCDTKPLGKFWLRAKTILPDEELNESVNGLIENILYWCKDEFDDYFNFDDYNKLN